MEAFGIEGGDCGSGAGRYAAGLFTMPDGSVRGVESVTRVEARAEPQADQGVERASRTTSEVAGSFRDALGASRAASPAVPLAVRLAVSTMRAGLGAIQEGLRPRAAASVEIAFADGAVVAALIRPAELTLIRRDVEIARGVLERAAGPIVTVAAPDTTPGEALTSIFRYEKRNGRLRRVATGKAED